MSTVLILCREARDAQRHADTLAEHPELRVVATTCEQRAVPSLVGEHRPDVLVMDLKTFDGPVYRLVGALRKGRLAAELKILLIAPDAEGPLLLETLQAGADSYVVDRADDGINMPRLAARINEVLRGEADMSPRLARQVLEHFDALVWQSLKRPAVDAGDPLALDMSERSVLAALSQGMAMGDIALMRGCSLHRLRSQLRGIYRKMHWDHRAGALTLAT